VPPPGTARLLGAQNDGKLLGLADERQMARYIGAAERHTEEKPQSRNGVVHAGSRDAILVSAGGPEAPPALKEQLAIGGRLVIPIGQKGGRQTLCKITRASMTHYDTRDLGGVTFVPLVVEHGWAEDGGG
jgi:protein-L-isoaspartate O-methyltransferase